MYRFLTGDVAALPFEISKQVNARVQLALQSNDPDLLYDLRHVNEGHKTRCDDFWNAAAGYIDEDSLQAVQS